MIAISIFEYNKEEEEKKLRCAEYEAGREEGKSEEIQKALTDVSFREKMYEKYHL